MTTAAASPDDPAQPGHKSFAQEFVQAVSEVDVHTLQQQIASTPGAVGAIQFFTKALPASAGALEAHISYALDYSAVSTVKLIFHVKNVSPQAMERLGRRMQQLCVEILMALPTEIRVEASESPLFRAQWDLIVWGVPAIRGPETQQLIIKAMCALFETA